MEFAIRLNGEDGGKDYWVLAVDVVGERFLIAPVPENVFRWVAMKDCTLLTAANPTVPRPVIPVAPQTPLTLDVRKLRGDLQGKS